MLREKSNRWGGVGVPVVESRDAALGEEEDMPKNPLVGVAATTMGAITLALAAVSCGGQGSSANEVMITQGVFRGLPATVEQARREGWVQNGNCFANQGIHYMLPGYGALNLLYTRDGNLIGFDLESRSPQPAPPWEHYPDGHEFDPTEHWMLHVYFDDPRGVC